MPDRFKRLKERSETDLWLGGLALFIPLAAIAKYGVRHGLWAAGAILYVVALFVAVPALALRAGFGIRLRFWEWIAIGHSVAFGAFGLATRDESLAFFTLLGASTGGFFALVLTYFAWRARK